MNTEGASGSGRSVRDLSWSEGERLSAEQQRLHPSIDRINMWGAGHPEVFAGVWLINDGFLAGTGPVQVGVGVAHRNVQELADELQALVDDQSLLVLVAKDLPESVLRAAQDRIVERWMQGQTDRRVTGCGVDIFANAVEVMLRAPDPVLEEQLRVENSGMPLKIIYGYMAW